MVLLRCPARECESLKAQRLGNISESQTVIRAVCDKSEAEREASRDRSCMLKLRKTLLMHDRSKLPAPVVSLRYVTPYTCSIAALWHAGTYHAVRQVRPLVNHR